jgi:hypothetical protein
VAPLVVRRAPGAGHDRLGRAEPREIIGDDLERGDRCGLEPRRVGEPVARGRAERRAALSLLGARVVVESPHAPRAAVEVVGPAVAERVIDALGLVPVAQLVADVGILRTAVGVHVDLADRRIVEALDVAARREAVGLAAEDAPVGRVDVGNERAARVVGVGAAVVHVRGHVDRGVERLAGVEARVGRW